MGAKEPNLSDCKLLQAIHSRACDLIFGGPCCREVIRRRTPLCIDGESSPCLYLSNRGF
jgi:hypothetical protein